MKQVLSGIVLGIFLLSANLLSAAPQPDIRLYDAQTEMSVFLTKSKTPGFLQYTNDRFSYQVDIPDIFTKVVRIPHNDDGLVLCTADGQASFRVSGGFNIDTTELKQHFAQAKAALPVAAAYAVQKDDFWVLSWLDQGKIYYRKFMLNNDYWCELELIYPEKQKSRFDKPVTHSSKSLAGF